MLLTAIISETTKSTSFNLLSIIIPSLVSIFGFLVTIYLNKRNLSNEINKKKIDVSINSLSDIPYKCIDCLDLTKSEKERVNTFKEIASKTFAYGSKDAIKILSESQQEIYKRKDNLLNEKENFSNMIFFILLACQIKADLTGVKVSPDFYLKIKLNDYEKHEEKFREINNQIVNSLKLNEFLIIK